MYDTEEEIRKKRRNLLIAIGVIVGIIILLLIFLLTRGGKRNSNSNLNSQISCTLGIQGNVVPDSNGIYHQPVTVEFKDILAISKDYQIVKHTIGTVDRSSNRETFTASNSGTYHLYGFIQDSAGRKGKCELKIELSMSVPTCELEVVKGTLGDNNWYRSDVEVGFKAMDANNPSVSIVKFYIDKELIDLNTEEVVKADPPVGNIEKYTLTDNMKTTLVGHVIDSTGNEGTCKLEVSKDTTVPTCKLKVNSGTKNSAGEYTDNPEIAFEEFKDDVSEIGSKGIGVTKNYTQETYKVTDSGKTTVVGYVKDQAGNEGTCSLDITRPGGSSGNNNKSTPTCSVKMDPSSSGSGIYSQSARATLVYSTTNGATITNYGLAENETYNQRKELVITNAGSHRVYGIVKDSNGNVARCSSQNFVVEKSGLLAASVKVGDYVGYDAGKWTETRGEKQTDGYYWGMKSGTSKQTGVKCDSNDLSTRNGWMVLSVSNGKVTLIHAGTPECIYHGRTTYNNVVNTMISRAASYVNSKYAEGYTALSCSTEGFKCNNTSFSGEVFITGTHYWVAQNGTNDTLYAISPKGTKRGFNKKSYGLRPVIILRADVMTSRKNVNIWVLK